MDFSTKRVAVIGLGNMGMRHIDAYTQMGARVVAAADMRPETNNILETKSPGANHYADWRTLLANETLDCVSIVTNGPSHAAITIAAAERGVPIIFTEKPMATNLADADAMIAACASAGSQLYINFTLRAFPAFQKLLALLREGSLGEIRIVTVMIGGARGLGCVGSHYVDLMRLVTRSEVKSVWGRIDTHGTPNPRGKQFRDPGGYGVFEFQNGARGYLEMSEDYPLPPTITIVGTGGRITADIGQNLWTAHTFSDKAYTPLPFDAGTPMDLTQGTARMLDDLATDASFVSTGEDGRKALEMIMGLHLSDRIGSPFVFPIEGDGRLFDVPMT